MSEEKPKAPSEYELKLKEEEISGKIERTKIEIKPEAKPLPSTEIPTQEAEITRAEIPKEIKPEIVLPQSASTLGIVRRIRSRPVGLQVGFETATIYATETGWYRFEFNEPFDEPPQVFVTIEYREGEPAAVIYPKPSMTVPRITPPKIGAITRSFSDPLVNAQNYANQLKENAKTAAIAILGYSWGWLWDWLRVWYFTIFIEVVFFLAFALGNFWNSTISPIGSAIRQVMADIKAICDSINSTVSSVSDAVNSLAQQTEAGFNSVISTIKGYIDDSVVRSIANLYKFSDLPMMKLNATAILTPTTTYVDVLGYEGSTLHILAIGKRKRTLEDIIRDEVRKHLSIGGSEQTERKGIFGLGLLPNRRWKND